ncbi:hypothetical protein N8083_01275 [Candidatus Pacebacteria bacterium]|nr:hypothetical protein [Candidatus Paceibacterota bacterium]
MIPFSIYALTAMVLAFIAGFFLGKQNVSGTSAVSKSADHLDNMRVDAQKAVAERTQNRKKQILDMMRESDKQQEELAVCRGEEIKKGSTRASVERLLEVSDRTAGTYLEELEMEGKVKQVGETGRSVYYVLIEETV